MIRSCATAGTGASRCCSIRCAQQRRSDGTFLSRGVPSVPRSIRLFRGNQPHGVSVTDDRPGNWTEPGCVNDPSRFRMEPRMEPTVRYFVPERSERRSAELHFAPFRPAGPFCSAERLLPFFLGPRYKERPDVGHVNHRAIR